METWVMSTWVVVPSDTVVPKNAGSGSVVSHALARITELAKSALTAHQYGVPSVGGLKVVMACEEPERPKKIRTVPGTLSSLNTRKSLVPIELPNCAIQPKSVFDTRNRASM